MSAVNVTGSGPEGGSAGSSESLEHPNVRVATARLAATNPSLDIFLLRLGDDARTSASRLEREIMGALVQRG
jgi:hypothetical protein